MPKIPETTTFKLILDLPTHLVADLDVFCAHHYGAPRSGVIRQAIQHFIEYEMKSDPKLARAIEQSRVQRLRSKAGPSSGSGA
jgi:metal-responsive CopG/Arc/MetJ family transcriptional regulator